MSIRLIAGELYKAIQEVKKLEKQLEQTPFEKQDFVKDRLRKVRAEKERMRKMLDGQKSR